MHSCYFWCIVFSTICLGAMTDFYGIYVQSKICKITLQVWSNAVIVFFANLWKLFYLNVLTGLLVTYLECQILTLYRECFMLAKSYNALLCHPRQRKTRSLCHWRYDFLLETLLCRWGQQGINEWKKCSKKSIYFCI